MNDEIYDFITERIYALDNYVPLVFTGLDLRLNKYNILMHLWDVEYNS